MNHLHQTLLSQLKDFGLDARDWRLEIQNLAGALFKVRLVNKSEAGLELQGWADQVTWLMLSYGEHL